RFQARVWSTVKVQHIEFDLCRLIRAATLWRAPGASWPGRAVVRHAYPAGDALNFCVEDHGCTSRPASLLIASYFRNSGANAVSSRCLFEASAACQASARQRMKLPPYLCMVV